MRPELPEWARWLVAPGILLAVWLYSWATGSPLIVRIDPSVYVWGAVLLVGWLLVGLAVVGKRLMRQKLRDALIRKGKWDPVKGPLVPMSDRLRDGLMNDERSRGKSRL